MARRLLFVVNVDWFFVSHRLPIALAAIEAGYDVHLATNFTGHRAALENAGIICHQIEIERGSAAALSSLNLMFGLWKLFRKLRPTIVHLVTIKPVIFGGIAARLAGVCSIFVSISGLGYVFIAAGLRARMLRSVVSLLYRLALSGRKTTIIVQNTSDEAVIHRMIRPARSNTVLIPGSGVDLEQFAYAPLPETETVLVVMAARLLGDKGVREFAEAARVLNAKRDNIAFLLAGDLDPDNPASVSASEVEEWREAGFLNLPGKVTHMAELLSSCNLVVLPSYREGMPKLLLEAAAVGRAIVTTDVPGCREAIIPGETGVLVPARSSTTLIEAIDELTVNRDLLSDMGRRGRQLAEDRFDIRHVIMAHLDMYNNA